MLPLFEGKPIARKQPLYWRNHLAPQPFKVALRIGDFKIIGSDDLTTFEMYNIKEDWQEKTDLSGQDPTRFEQMKRMLIEHDKSVLEDGPDWWKHDKAEEKRKKKK